MIVAQFYKFQKKAHLILRSYISSKHVVLLVLSYDRAKVKISNFCAHTNMVDFCRPSPIWLSYLCIIYIAKQVKFDWQITLSK